MGQRRPTLRESSPCAWHSKHQCWCHSNSWLQTGEWHLHIGIMNQMYTRSGWVEMDLFASNQSTDCLLKLPSDYHNNPPPWMDTWCTCGVAEQSCFSISSQFVHITITVVCHCVIHCRSDAEKGRWSVMINLISYLQCCRSVHVCCLHIWMSLLAEKWTWGFLWSIVVKNFKASPHHFLLLYQMFHCAHSRSHDTFDFSNLHSFLLQFPLKDFCSDGED